MKPCHSRRIAMLSLAVSLSFAAAVVAADEAKEPQLEQAELGATRNVHAFGPTLLCGQPDLAALEAAKRRGIKIVVSLREEGETDFDEAEAAKSAGLQFRRIPFRAPETLDDKVFAAALKILANSKDKPVMLHCGSANRVGAIWAAHRALDDGISVEAAIKEGKEVGLRNPAYEKITEEYIRRSKKR